MLASIALLTLVALQDPPLAPDGRPGLGSVASAREYGRLLVDPEPERRAEIDAWLALESEIRALRDACERAYRERGCFAWLGKRAVGPDPLADLHARFRELEQDPLGAVRVAGDAGSSFASAFLDARFRLRMAALDAYPDEARELRAGLALLRATQEGYVQLEDAEAREIARRVDLAAALLRAIRLDLHALKPDTDARAPGSPDPAWIAELRDLARVADPSEREARLAELVRRARQVESRVASQLFWPALSARLALDLSRRSAAREQARRIAREIRPLLPETEEGADPPPEIAALKKHERYRFALHRAGEGLAFDPLDDELAYFAGLATDFVYDRRQSRAWFDRYLALRGIRTHEKMSDERELTAEERYALDVVQSLPLLGR